MIPGRTPETGPRTGRPPYQMSPEMTRRIGAGIVALATFFLAAGALGLPLAFLFAAAVGYCIAEQFPAKLARTVALAFAIWSHGPADGARRDRCFPARADHFLHWIRTGENREPPPAPPTSPWCGVCGAGLIEHEPGGPRYGDHPFQPKEADHA